MKLLNPIYDASFKHLMQDARVARFFLSILLNKEIEIDGFQPQEISIRNEERNTGYSIPRMDFVAIIREEINGEIKRKKVLIELQQCLYANDVNRFRTYLGKNYSLDTINGQKESLEIICIYILGFSVGMPCAVVKTSLDLIDASTGERLDMTKENIPFIGMLNHQSLVIDVTQLNSRLKSKVDKLLAVFNPQFRDENRKTITIPDDIALDIKSLSNQQESNNPIISKLENALYDADVLYAIEQQELFDAHIAKQDKEAEKRGLEKGKIEGEKLGLEKGKIEGEKLGLEKGKIEGEKLKAIEIARNLNLLNMPIEKIMQVTGLTQSEIDDAAKFNYDL